MVTIGDIWLQVAISNKLIQPIPNALSSTWWRQLPQQLKDLVRRDENGFVDPQGDVYGCPYKWGATLIAFRSDKIQRALGRPVNDWKDLLHPSLKGRVGMVASTREIIGSILKGSGVSYNASAQTIQKAVFTDPCTDDIQQSIALLSNQVRLFTSQTSDGLKALSAGDLWAFVGWSSDLVQFARRTTNIELTAAVSGTSLWADVMTMPTGCKSPYVSQHFFHYWCTMMNDPVFCAPSNGIAGGACPSMLLRNAHRGFDNAGNESKYPSAVGSCAKATLPIVQTKHDRGQLLNKKIILDATLERSEFLHPLDTATEDVYKFLL